MNIFDLIIKDNEAVQLDDVFLNQENRSSIQQLIREHSYVDKLLAYNLPVNNKILLEGQSGCGKTTTAKAIAQALGKPLIILNLSNVICARIGETSQNIRQIFEKAARDKAVLFLDEFDQIGKARGNDDNDVGEMRRLVNTLIQLIDYYPNNALLICATNHIHIIDIALQRRFQVKISFLKPDNATLNAYYDKLISNFPERLQSFDRKYNISFAEAKDYTFTILKGKLLEEFESTTN